MMNVATIERTVDVSTDRRIYIDLPEAVPHGQVHIIVRYEPLPEQFSRKDIDARRDMAKSLVGILKGNTTTLEEARAERLARQ